MYTLLLHCRWVVDSSAGQRHKRHIFVLLIAERLEENVILLKAAAEVVRFEE